MNKQEHMQTHVEIFININKYKKLNNYIFQQYFQINTLKLLFRNTSKVQRYCKPIFIRGDFISPLTANKLVRDD